jgi:hypothetical protein
MAGPLICAVVVVNCQLEPVQFMVAVREPTWLYLSASFG